MLAGGREFVEPGCASGALRPGPPRLHPARGGQGVAALFPPMAGDRRRFWLAGPQDFVGYLEARFSEP
eukprot:5810005-Lingulodinium_polyedra.AAC.1